MYVCGGGVPTVPGHAVHWKNCPYVPAEHTLSEAAPHEQSYAIVLVVNGNDEKHLPCATEYGRWLVIGQVAFPITPYPGTLHLMLRVYKNLNLNLF